jgi:hypothetical protein
MCSKMIQECPMSARWMRSTVVLKGLEWSSRTGLKPRRTRFSLFLHPQGRADIAFKSCRPEFVSGSETPVFVGSL